MALSFIFHPTEMAKREAEINALTIFGLSEIFFFKFCKWIKIGSNDMSTVLEYFPNL